MNVYHFLSFSVLENTQKEKDSHKARKPLFRDCEHQKTFFREKIVIRKFFSPEKNLIVPKKALCSQKAFCQTHQINIKLLG